MKILRIDVTLPNEQQFIAKPPGPDPHEELLTRNKRLSQKLPPIKEILACLPDATNPDRTAFYLFFVDNRKVYMSCDQNITLENWATIENNLAPYLAQVNCQETLDVIYKYADLIISGKAKIEVILQTLSETKNIMLDNKLKLAEEAERLRVLVEKTEILTNNTLHFKRAAKEVRNNNRTCGGIFSLFSKISTGMSSYIWPQEEGYKFEYYSPPSPK